MKGGLREEGSGGSKISFCCLDRHLSNKSVCSYSHPEVNSLVNLMLEVEV